jgi:hypothetical protein
MLVDEYDTAVLKSMEATEDAGDQRPETTPESDLEVNWRLGSRSSRLTSAARIVSDLARSRPVFSRFSQRLHDFFSLYYPNESLPHNLETLKVSTLF